MKKVLILLILLGLIFSPAFGTDIIKLATTTSTDNSGLLKVLLAPFEKKYNIRVDVISAGTGKAIKLGENGDVDAILVHARSAEDKFVKAGFGVNRRNVMYNDFIILGPQSDPAGVSAAKNVFKAFTRIAINKIDFISRGDDSGTHKKEIYLWQMAHIIPKGKWYNSVGQGMGSTLQIANEKQAYTLADRGTYLAYKDKIDLKIIFEGNQSLYNPYGIIAVNPALHKHANYENAMLLIGWITSIKGQEIIRNFKIRGETLFKPLATK